jgi:hypothetical protein
LKRVAARVQKAERRRITAPSRQSGIALPIRKRVNVLSSSLSYPLGLFHAERERL